MKKLNIAVSLLLLFSACSSGSSGTGTTTVTPTPPVSTFNITFQGSTYSSSIVTASTTQVGSYGGTTNGWLFTMPSGGDTKNLLIQFTQFVGFAVTNGLGTYYANSHIPGTSSMMQDGRCTLIDYGHGNASYRTDNNDTTSYVTVTLANSTEVKGTFNVKLNNGTGSYYTATGNFDYKH